MRNGYEMVYMPTHHRADSTGCVYEHIVVAEKKLGRKLNDGECVHHKNEVRNDNREENLIVFKTVADHTAFHMGCDIQLEGDVYIALMHINNVCPICGTSKDYHAKLCLSCSRIASRKVERPSKDVLLELITSMSFIQIGKLYGVSDNSIRKWCKSYGLPYKQKDIKNLIVE
jgi:hypothetical protein